MVKLSPLEQDIKDLNFDGEQDGKANGRKKQDGRFLIRTGKVQYLVYSFGEKDYVVENVYGHPPTRVIGVIDGKLLSSPRKNENGVMALGFKDSHGGPYARVSPVDEQTEREILKRFCKE